jgi:hypothetical protein
MDSKTEPELSYATKQIHALLSSMKNKTFANLYIKYSHFANFMIAFAVSAAIGYLVMLMLPGIIGLVLGAVLVATLAYIQILGQLAWIWGFKKRQNKKRKTK